MHIQKALAREVPALRSVRLRVAPVPSRRGGLRTLKFDIDRLYDLVIVSRILISISPRNKKIFLSSGVIQDVGHAMKL